MRKISLVQIVVSLILTVFLMGTNIGCGDGGTDTPPDANTVGQVD